MEKQLAALSARSMRRRSQRSIAKQRKKQLSRAPRIRVLPITMMCAFLLLCIKVADVVDGSQRVSEALIAGRAIAADEPADVEKAQAEAVAPGDAVQVNDEEGNAEASAGDEAEGEMEMAKAEGEGEEIDPTKVRPKEAEIMHKQFSNIELDILQSLSERREEIDARSEELEMKQKLLEATEMRINGKIQEMEMLRAKMEAMIAKHEEIENKEIMSLVKIYENMKPRDAADIFNQMEMDILFEVIDKMSERRAAPVLAAMDPIKAMEVTTELAERRKLRPVVPPEL